MARMKFYKLGKQSSIFYDPKSTLKVTKGVPGKTDQPNKTILTASRNGHIIEIQESEFNAMMDKLPEATKKAIKLEQPTNITAKPIVKEKEKEQDEEEDESEEEEEEEEEDGKEDTEMRENLIKRLKKLKLKEKEYNKVSEKSNEEIEAYLEKNEE